MRWLLLFAVVGCEEAETHDAGNPYPSAARAAECQVIPSGVPAPECNLWVCCDVECWQQDDTGEWARPCEGAECDTPIQSGVERCWV